MSFDADHDSRELYLLAARNVLATMELGAVCMFRVPFRVAPDATTVQLDGVVVFEGIIVLVRSAFLTCVGNVSKSTSRPVVISATSWTPIAAGLGESGSGCYQINHEHATSSLKRLQRRDLPVTVAPQSAILERVR